MTIYPDTIVTRSTDCMFADLSGSAAILNQRSGLYFGLNEVAATVWNQLEEPQKVKDIAATLLASYEIDENTCSADLDALLHAMKQHQLVSLNNETT